MAVQDEHVVTIQITKRTYDRLKRKADPFEDTPDSVIIRLLDKDDAGLGMQSNGIPDATSADSLTADPTTGTGLEVDIVVDNPLAPPSLKHAKVLRAVVNGREIAKPNWTTVRQSVVTIGIAEEGHDLRWLLGVCPVNAVPGVKNDEGYTHYPELGVSIQGQNAHNAWGATVSAARALGVPVKVWFQWRAKPDAKYPGKRGLLTVSGH